MCGTEASCDSAANPTCGAGEADACRPNRRLSIDSHLCAEVILLDLNAINARYYHLRSLYTSVMLTLEHYPRRIFTRHAAEPNQANFAGEYH
jgi:hypothetical protein